MTDRPILYSGAMVRAMLRGEKTQTRRIIMSGEEIAKGPWVRLRPPAPGHGWQVGLENYNAWQPLTVRHEVGDRLWVREEWSVNAAFNDMRARDLRVVRTIAYWADGKPEGTGRRRASMHMPRQLSRITNLVSEVRVQRLQDISEADAKAEGVEPKLFGAEHGGEYRRAYITLWNAINAARGYPWASNPWVVATTFGVATTNIDLL